MGQNEYDEDVEEISTDLGADSTGSRQQHITTLDAAARLQDFAVEPANLALVWGGGISEAPSGRIHRHTAAQQPILELLQADFEDE